MTKHTKTLLLVLLLILVVQPAAAKSSPLANSIIDTAFQLVEANCQDVHRNQACYGHAQLVAAQRLGVDSFAFENSGDVEDLAKIQSMRLQGLNMVEQTWGIVMMQLRADLPESAAENVTILAFGEVALENAVQPTTAVQVTTTANANLRQRPNIASAVVASVARGRVATAVERLADNSWMRIRLQDSGAMGWIFADLIEYENDIERLNVNTGDADYYDQPMQAFFFESGAESPEFDALPHNGLLIQTPEGVGEVNLLVNEINIQLGSTVFFEAQPGGFMTVSTIEGHADVRVGNIEFTAFPGTKVMVPLDANLKASGPPMPPQPYDMDAVAFLPYGILQRPVEAGEPLTQVDIAALIEESSGQSDGSRDCSGQSCDEHGRPDCHGQECAANGNRDCIAQECAAGNRPECVGGACANPNSGNGQGNGQGSGSSRGQSNGGGNPNN